MQKENNNECDVSESVCLDESPTRPNSLAEERGSSSSTTTSSGQEESTDAIPLTNKLLSSSSERNIAPPQTKLSHHDDIIARNDLPPRSLEYDPMVLHSSHVTILTTAAMPLVLFIVTCFIVWYRCYYNLKRQKEWQQSSEDVLNTLRQRTLGQLHSKENIETDVVAAVKNELVLEKNLLKSEITVEAHDELAEKNEISVTEQLNVENMQQFPNATGAITANCDDRTTLETNTETNSADTIPRQLLKIREQQQKQHETNIKSTQQKRRQQLKTRQRVLHTSLQHDAAEVTYQRRRNNIMLEEEEFLRSSSHDQHQDQEQPPLLNELEEMERIALLQQQNLEYLESLQRDQERTVQKAIKDEKRLRRKKLIDDAKQRLSSMEVELFGLLDDFLCDSNHHSSSNNESSAITNESMDSTKRVGANPARVRVRLILPSGRRTQAVFDSQHAMGLVYDLALVLLDRENLLQSQERDGEERVVIDSSCDDANSDDEVNAHDPPNLPKSYSNIQLEWEELFPSFSIASTFPKQIFDELANTLEQCELGSSVMLMVVVESD